MSPSASVRPSLWTQSPPCALTKQWLKLLQSQPCQLSTVHMTFQPSAQAHETPGALSAAATITTTIPSHHATPQPSTLPHRPPGMVTTTAALVFTYRVCHHLISTQFTSLKWSTTMGDHTHKTCGTYHIPHSPQRATSPHSTCQGCPPSSGDEKTQWTPPKTPIAGHLPPFIVQCHCSTTLPVQQE